MLKRACIEVCPGCPYGSSDIVRTPIELRAGGVVADRLAVYLDDGVPVGAFGQKVLFFLKPSTRRKTRVKIIGEGPSANDHEGRGALNLSMEHIVRGTGACLQPRTSILARTVCHTIDGYKTPRPQDEDDRYHLSFLDIKSSTIVPILINRGNY